MSLLLIGGAVLLAVLLLVLILVIWYSKSNHSDDNKHIKPIKPIPITPILPGRPQDCSKSCKFYETAGAVTLNGQKKCYCAPMACNNLPPTSAGTPNLLAKQCTSGLECVNNTCQLQKCAPGNTPNTADGVCPLGMSCNSSQKCDFDVYSVSGFSDSSLNADYVLASSPYELEATTFTPFKGFVSTSLQNLPGVGMNQTSFNPKFLSAYSNDQAGIPYPATRFTGFGAGTGEIYSLLGGNGYTSYTIAGIGAPAPSVTVTKKH